MRTSTAFFNHGRWVATCPADGCLDARALYPQLPTTDGTVRLSPHPVYVQRCAEGHEFRIEAPPDSTRAGIETVLLGRPRQYRDWLPTGHPLGAHGYPTNQTLEQLAAENDEVHARLAAAKAAERDKIRSVLADLGIEVRPDGTFSGSL